MQFNLIYDNNGTRTPSGGTDKLSVAGLSGVSVYFSAQTPPAVAPNVGNSDAAAVIQSNGELIGNARRKSNPFPPGLTS
jgi:hypothetical protein